MTMKKGMLHRVGSNDSLLKVPGKVELLDNVLLLFANNIPQDARDECTLNDGTKYPRGADENTQRRHLVSFVRDRLESISHLEYALWLNGLLPFITPRELFIWRLRQYVEYIWAFQLPDDEDLSVIFNSTKLRAAHLTAEFTARFRKALLFPISLRRLYKILRNEDPNHPVVDDQAEYKKALGRTFKIPSSRYVQDANSLIEEYRFRVGGFLRDAALISRSENIMWVNDRVLELARDDALKKELFDLYDTPKEVGNIG